MAKGKRVRDEVDMDQMHHHQINSEYGVPVDPTGMEHHLEPSLMDTSTLQHQHQHNEVLMDQQQQEQPSPNQEAPTTTGPGKGNRKKGRLLPDDDDTVSKRTMQNRKAQREFRQRRANYMKDLEDKVKSYESTHVAIGGEVHRILHALREENASLRASVQRVDPSLYFSLPPPVAVPAELLVPPPRPQFPTGAQYAKQQQQLAQHSPSSSAGQFSPDIATTMSKPLVHALLPSNQQGGGVRYLPQPQSAMDVLVSAVSDGSGGSGIPLSQGIPAPMSSSTQAQ